MLTTRSMAAFREQRGYRWIYGPGTTGPNTQVPVNNSENINGADVVLWEEGYLPHNAYLADGITPDSQTWHSTGVRLYPVWLQNTPPVVKTFTAALFRFRTAGLQTLIRRLLMSPGDRNRQ